MIVVIFIIEPHNTDNLSETLISWSVVVWKTERFGSMLFKCFLIGQKTFLASKCHTADNVCAHLGDAQLFPDTKKAMYLANHGFLEEITDYTESNGSLNA